MDLVLITYSGWCAIKQNQIPEQSNAKLLTKFKKPILLLNRHIESTDKNSSFEDLSIASLY